MFSQGLCRFAAVATGAAARCNGPHRLSGPIVAAITLTPPFLTCRRRPFHSTTATFHNTTTSKSQLTNMAASKDYRLLCLENPLLGKPVESLVPPAAAPSVKPYPSWGAHLGNIPG